MLPRKPTWKRHARGAPSTEDGAIEAFIDVCVRTDEGRLLVVGWAHRSGVSTEIALLAGGRPFDAPEPTVIRGQRPDVAAHLQCSKSEPVCFVVIAELGADWKDDTPIAIRVHAGAHHRDVTLAPRGGTTDEIFPSVGSFTEAERTALDEALGIPRPQLGIEDLVPFVRAAVDHALIFSNMGVFVVGWLLDPSSTVESVHVRVGDATSRDLLPSLGRAPRPDVAEGYRDQVGATTGHGFYGFVPLPVSGTEPKLDLLLRTRDGRVGVGSAALRPCVGQASELLELVARNARTDSDRAQTLLTDHFAPAFDAIWTELRRAPSKTTVRDFGELPNDPRYAVVVPLFRRVDFVLHQLAQFCRDDDFNHTELVYVLDDPTMRAEALAVCREAHDLFGLSFRLVDLGRNAGFAAANNAGVRHSTARHVFLVNSDVIPSKPGWVGRLSATLDATESAGIVAPRLLYYDDTIQHDGMTFEATDVLGGLFLNQHPGKGLPKSLAPGPNVATVPAVTGACFVVSRKLYDELGGLDEDFVLGDFEDSDFCLKARAAGHRCYVSRDVELFHLERQSISTLGDDWRVWITLHNARKHQERWSDDLAQLSATRLFPGDPPS